MKFKSVVWSIFFLQKSENALLTSGKRRHLGLFRTFLKIKFTIVSCSFFDKKNSVEKVGKIPSMRMIYSISNFLNYFPLCRELYGHESMVYLKTFLVNQNLTIISPFSCLFIFCLLQNQTLLMNFCAFCQKLFLNFLG